MRTSTWPQRFPAGLAAAAGVPRTVDPADLTGAQPATVVRPGDAAAPAELRRSRRDLAAAAGWASGRTTRAGRWMPAEVLACAGPRFPQWVVPARSPSGCGRGCRRPGPDR